VNLGLPPEALAVCDFRAVACFGPHVWVAGKPGGVVLHSGDSGKTWDVQKTEAAVPVNGLYFLTDRVGWMTCELGCIFGTTDGGKTWVAQRSGGRRAAVLFVNASHRAVPLDVVSVLGHGDGYLCAAVGLTCADPRTADPQRAGDADRLRYAMRLAGGATGDVSWAFPVAAHAAGLAPLELMASWDPRHGGKAAEQLLRQAVCAIRMWQPEVIVADTVVEGGDPAAALALHAANKAFEAAADPNVFPEQITQLGLKPWKAKKLYGPCGAAEKDAQVRMDQTVYSSVLVDSPMDYAEPATRILADDSAVTGLRAFKVVSHRFQGAEKHSALVEGVTLAYGGEARREQVAVTADPEALQARRAASQTRRRLEGMAAVGDVELAGADKVLALLGTELKQMPADTAARTAFAVATRFARDGKWAEAREVFGLLAAEYPGHPLAIEAFRWLTRYHASSEARRRTEIRQKLALKSATIQPAVTNGGGVIQASGVVANATRPTVSEDVYHMHSPEAVLAWHQACLDLEPRLAALGPVYSRDPAAWLCFLAARRQVGRHNDAVAFVRDYFKNSPGAAATTAGTDPWRDCLAAELWMTDRNLIAAPPKGVEIARYTETRLLLDGKLDDACWVGHKPMTLSVASAASDRAEDAKAFAEAYTTEARFAYDDKYLYIAVSCAHAPGEKVPPVAKRTRDADMTGRDRMDILLDLDRDYQTYYRFRIDNRGELAEDCWGDGTWNPKYFVAFHSGDDAWAAEIAIPLAELTAERPSHGRAWAVNVLRVVPGKGLLSWSTPAGDEPRPEGMGLLQFRSER
jgi:hypothetical protein